MKRTSVLHPLNLAKIVHIHKSGVLLTFLLFLSPASAAPIQTDGYDLSWWTVDGGGGLFHSAPYTLGGTVGQPDAAVWIGSGYTLTGGFWGDVATRDYTAPIAAFSASPLSGAPPLDVQFIDQSTDDIVSWDWEFGDGGVSGARHPSYTYTITGTYTVTLTVSGPGGSDAETKVDYITIGYPPDVRTLVLVNRQKLETLYGAAEAAQVMDKLDELAAHENVQGVLVQVESDASVAAAYAAWDADPTSTARADAVAEAIKALVDGQWSAYLDLEYLVIVGDDRVIPFRRVPDRTRYPESYYRYVSNASTVGAALHDDMTLTDDYYADAAPTVPSDPRWDGHDLYIPDLGVGRLIETPSEIVAQVDAFLAEDEITASEALVSGYGFVWDGARAICNALSDDGLATDCSLVGYSWDAADLVSKMLNTRHDLVSINGHAYHYAMCTPTGCVHSSDVASATANHARALFYTLGCHSGLNVPPSNPYEPLDTAQAFVQQQANYVANTGYGWGYIFSVGLSEQLMLDFTERLVYGQSATLGPALVAAKQEYYLNQGHFGYYDEKIMIESTLYGLPMYRYNTPATASSQELEPQETVVQEQVRALGDGLTVNGLSYQFPALLAESSDDGAYYSLGGLVHASDGEPIQPKYTADLSFPGTQAHGVVFKGGVYTDVASFDPVVERAITETATLDEPAFDTPGWYPAQFYRLNRLERGDRLVTLLGQFNAQDQTERLYDRLSFDVYYHSSSDDWTAPVVVGVNHELAGDALNFSVTASDASGIEAVVIAYTHGSGKWFSADLEQSQGSWSGSLAGNADTEFLVQVVDGAGNVTVWKNEGWSVYLPLVTSSH